MGRRIRFEGETEITQPKKKMNLSLLVSVAWTISACGSTSIGNQTSAGDIAESSKLENNGPGPNLSLGKLYGMLFSLKNRQDVLRETIETNDRDHSKDIN